ncbi:hypothetical protein L1987_22377 [Smallanthus sonchifolius]|uniref:Uncharacterized protein n=1 Tax=Smallanthus sonchifolius TaxID=185202 RepID=A0ACB9IG61_9ASTR|nr:hypothetical protein L1987_22377 [Smallanthus sonchifolius]
MFKEKQRSISASWSSLVAYCTPSFVIIVHKKTRNQRQKSNLGFHLCDPNLCLMLIDVDLDARKPKLSSNLEFKTKA